MRKFKATPQKKLIGMAILFVLVPLFLLWYWVFFLGHKPGTDTMAIIACVAVLAAFLYLRYKKQLAKAQSMPTEGEELPAEGESLPEDDETESEEKGGKEAEFEEGGEEGAEEDEIEEAESEEAPEEEAEKKYKEEEKLVKAAAKKRKGEKR